MTAHAFNAGGRPASGLIATSAGFRMTVDSIGAAVRDAGATSASFKVRNGMTPTANAPGEVRDLRFTDPLTLAWDPDGSTAAYNVYRGTTSTLPGGFGSCYQSGLTATQLGEAAGPPPAVAWFYFVTAENALAEEGTKGLTSTGAERSNLAPCP